MDGIKFRLAARTDAAGKYNPNAPLEGNEDNMFVDCFLDDNKQGVFMGDVIVDLSERGCLMVVADGMGGMNAGEVASDIAIKTVEKYFAPGKLDEKVFKDSKSRISYMEEVVVAADAAIKADSTSNPEHEGMGSTIIMAWLCDNEICLTWCGDSRAYLFRPGQGFWQVSKDHSYVQGLVDEGKITEVEAFDHPYGNIITRSLGDPDKKARPESRSFKVYQDDIFMLCSDGLSGVVRDRKTYRDGQRLDTDNLEDIIAENRESMAECRDRLFEAAQRNDWYDNVTAILCEIVQGEPAPKGNKGNEPIPNTTSSEGFYGSNNAPNFKRKRLKILWFTILIVLLGAVGFLTWSLLNRYEDDDCYQKCKDGQSIALCDEYLEEHPNGKYREEVETLKNKLLEQMEPDPIPEKLVEAEAESSEPEKPKDPKSTTSNSSRNQNGTGATGTGSVRGSSSSENSGGGDSLDDEDDESGQTVDGKTEQPDDNSISEPEKKGLVEDENKLKQDGLVEDPTVTPGQSNKPNNNLSQEEIMFQNTQGNNATIENCCKYVERYGSRTKNISQVLISFQQLYAKKFNKASETIEGLDKFLKEHEVIMERMGLTGNGKYDAFWRKKAKEAKEKLSEDSASSSHTSGAQRVTIKNK